MPVTTLNIRTEFKCSHRLANPKLSDIENEKIYGKCSNPNGHGHNYKVTVTLLGEVNPDTGMIMERKQVQARIHELLDDILDHTFLNETLGDDIIPSGENIIQAVWKKLENGFPPHRVVKVHLEETRKNSFEYTGN